MEVSGRKITASDEILNTCDTCEERRYVVRGAYGYCIECRLYMCEDCYNLHRDPPPCRKHRLLGGARMPKKRLPAVDRCERHTDELIKYLCKTHADLACQKCAFREHRTCKDVCEISHLSRDPQRIQWLKELTEKIKRLELKADNNLQTVKENISKIGSNKHQAKDDVKKFCKSMHNYLYQLEQRADEEVDTVGENGMKRMNEIKDGSDSVNVELKVVTLMLETNRDPEQEDMLFIAMHKAEELIKALDEKLSTLIDNNVIEEYTFKPNDQLKCLLTDIESVGDLVFRDVTQMPFLQSLSDPLKPAGIIDTITADADGVINVSTSIDKTCCRITGCTMLEGDTTLAIADMANSSVKVVDVRQRKVIFQLRLSDWPWDITLTQPDLLAVTQTAAKKIHFLSVVKGSSLIRRHQISVSGHCRGIACNDDRLFVSFTNPEQVQILSMKGKVQKTISAWQDPQILLANSFYLTLSDNISSSFYVSDCDTRTIYSLDMSGKVKVTYRDLGLQRPHGVCVARAGTVVVCGKGSNSIYMLSSDCTKGKVLLGEFYGVSNPECVAYSSDTSILFVGQEDSDVMMVFKMKQR